MLYFQGLLHAAPAALFGGAVPDSPSLFQLKPILSSWQGRGGLHTCRRRNF